MSRVTDKDLDGIAERINRYLGCPVGYEKGSYMINRAYGRVSLNLLMENGGEKNVIGSCTKAELASCMYAFLEGILTERARHESPKS